MPPHRQGTKPADVRLEEGRPQRTLRPFGVPRWVGALLYGLFAVVLLIPLVRRFRRRPAWNAVRAAAAILTAGLAAALLVGALESPWWWAVAGSALALSLVGRTSDPDAERKLQRRLRADYLLNGGRFVSGRLPNSEALPAGGELYLLLRGEHLLVVPRRGLGEVHSALNVRQIQSIRVDGAAYVPVYVSEAKDPPVRETEVDRRATSDLEITLESGETLVLRYDGAFHKHLAETAAHAVHSVRERCTKPAELPVLRA